MAQGPQDMLNLGASMAQASSTMALTALEGMRRLAELNLQTARKSLESSADQITALLAARDVQTLTQLVSTLAQPSPEKFTAYAQAVTAIARDTQGDLANLVREQVERTNREIAASVEQLARSAPAGSEGAMAFIRQAMDSANRSYDQFNQNLQQMMSAGGAGAAASATPAPSPAGGKKGR